jgi:putative pyruvate formate lyase activating enzyme
MNIPVYQTAMEKGLLHHKVESSREMFLNCRLCPRYCGVNRMEGETGVCRSSAVPRISSYNLHFGEEPPISGSSGSGTIFFSGCNLNCIFCQNYPISQLDNGREFSISELAGIMLELRDRGAHNINFVTPTHFMPAVLAALEIAVEKGLNIPLVYNCGGYESPEALELLDGIIDIYMPDAKYAGREMARQLSSAPDYPRFNRMALKEMYRQAGPMIVDEQGIAVKGMLIRHLVLPNGTSSSPEILRFIAEELGTDVFISLMSQYFPAYKAVESPIINRRINVDEYREAVECLEELGFESGWVQPDP